VDELLERGDCDFVEHVAARLPMMTIWDLMGLPDGDRERITRAADAMVSWNDPEVMAGREPIEVMFEAIMAVTGAALELADHRREHPADDLMSSLVSQEIDGERLSDDEIGAFFVLLAVAGNDTTRHTTSHALRALTDHPGQRALVLENPETAVEEFVRWATPVMTFRRTATEDTEIRGVSISEGAKVVLVYSSANRDEDAFERPREFDVTRSPNHHAGFGGGGPHYCMGASLARTQLRAIYTELLERAPRIEAGEPVRLVGNFINGIKTMPCAL
jgi:cytochrome P450